jgi:hypothetical protein
LEACDKKGAHRRRALSRHIAGSILLRLFRFVLQFGRADFKAGSIATVVVSLSAVPDQFAIAQKFRFFFHTLLQGEVATDSIRRDPLLNGHDH